MGEDDVDNTGSEEPQYRTLGDRSINVLGRCLPFLEHIEIGKVSDFRKRLASFKNAVITSSEPGDRLSAAQRFRAICRIGINIFNSRNEWGNVQNVADYYDDWSLLIDGGVMGGEINGLPLETPLIADEDFDLFLATPSGIERMKEVAEELYGLDRKAAAVPGDPVSVGAGEVGPISFAVVKAQEQAAKAAKLPTMAPKRLTAAKGRMTDVRSVLMGMMERKRLRTAAAFGELSSEHLCKEKGIGTKGNFGKLCEAFRKI